MNINTELFRRTTPDKKLQIIENLTQYELFCITETTIKRIIREAGSGKKGSPNKTLYISRKNITGNNWNSDIESWSIWKGKIWIGFYLQYSNTDTNTDDYYSNFKGSGEYLGSYEYEDRYGHSQTTYFRYYAEDKAKAIRALLKQYIENKYHDKLCSNEKA